MGLDLGDLGEPLDEPLGERILIGLAGRRIGEEILVSVIMDSDAVSCQMLLVKCELWYRLSLYSPPGTREPY